MIYSFSVAPLFAKQKLKFNHNTRPLKTDGTRPSVVAINAGYSWQLIATV
jgi:hypothetical protein